jgi:hypothetical protein
VPARDVIRANRKQKGGRKEDPRPVLDSGRLYGPGVIHKTEDGEIQNHFLNLTLILDFTPSHHSLAF